ncbi:hypothetical protein Tsubulata_012759 [Turnera subulata]|uniref:DUF4283 domain-containing protein n=1 Tax=Turnera subulata TaxID=218843 RepID=A0A9Q0FVK5_9ROSI|nr:hypothetical protein Tsubulata_012759 [Turnera subulata]
MGDSALAGVGGDHYKDNDDDHVLLDADGQVMVATATTGLDVQTGDKPMSYLEKLKAGGPEEQQEADWLEEEEEVAVEPGDIITGTEGEIPTLDLSLSFQKRLEKRWEQAVIVQLLGKSISYRVLTAKIRSLWQPVGPFKVIDLENNFFVVKFADKRDYLHCLVDGPWTVFNSALCVFPWNSEFCASNGRVDRAVVWVRFPDIPLHTYHPSVLNALGDLVGNSVRIDQATRDHQRGRFAKIAVEVDLTNPLKGTIRFRGKEQKVIYEGLPTLCYQCGSANHTMEACSARSQSSAHKPSSSDDAPGADKGKEKVGTQSTGGSDHRTGAGAWMNAPVRQRRTQPRKSSTPVVAPSPNPNVTTGSRYEILGEDLDRNGGIEETETGGLGPWIVVAEKKGPKIKKIPKTSKTDHSRNPQNKPNPANTSSHGRTPLKDTTNTGPSSTQPMNDLRVNKSPTITILQNLAQNITSPPPRPSSILTGHQTDTNLNQTPRVPTNKPQNSQGQHTAASAASTPLISVLTKEEAESAAEQSRLTQATLNPSISPLHRTKHKPKSPNLNHMEETEAPPIPATTGSSWGLAIKRGKLPAFKRRGQKGDLSPMTAEEETMIVDEEMNMEEEEGGGPTGGAHCQDIPNPNPLS